MWWALTGLAAAAISWLTNSWLIDRYSSSGRVWASPLVEEAAKTGLALLASTSVVLSHACFGAVEAVYEIWVKKEVGAGGMAFVSHLLLGIVTVELYRWSNTWPGAALGAAAVHAAWNGCIRCFFKDRSRG